MMEGNPWVLALVFVLAAVGFGCLTRVIWVLRNAARPPEEK